MKKELHPAGGAAFSKRMIRHECGLFRHRYLANPALHGEGWLSRSGSGIP
jgi:hypothetical protein